MASNWCVSSLVWLLPPSPDHLSAGVSGFQLRALCSPAGLLQALELVVSLVVRAGGDKEIMGMSTRAGLLPGWIWLLLTSGAGFLLCPSDQMLALEDVPWGPARTFCSCLEQLIWSDRQVFIFIFSLELLVLLAFFRGKDYEQGGQNKTKVSLTN